MTNLKPPKNHKDVKVDLTMQAAVATSTPHVFYHPHLNKYFYSDETQYINERPYDTEALAAQGMRDYSTFSLDGPEKINEVKLLLNTVVGLDTYTCWHVAQAAFREGRGEDAIIALRTCVDKLAVHSTHLAALVRNDK